MEYPRAILHFDGDAFFASVAQTMNYKLRGKPVVTGAERGAATSLSYEAKARGAHRGMRLSQIKIQCPDVIIVASDYVSYALYAQRMYSIVRSYTPLVEEYSIDECFADITGLDEEMGMSYEEIARCIKAELEDSLGITFGVGLAPNKTLAKAASKAHKPAGFTKIPSSEIPTFLARLNVHSVWGLGGASGTKLTSLGAETAQKFAEHSDEWLAEHRLGKAYRDIWLELRGQYIKKLSLKSSAPGSIMSTRTFTPPSTNRTYIFSQLSENVERVCGKARRHGLKAKGMSFYLKTQEFTYHSVSFELTVPTNSPSEILGFIDTRFNEVYAESVLYRASGITIRSFVAEEEEMHDFFGEMQSNEKKARVFTAVDTVNRKYGRQTIMLGSSLKSSAYREKTEGRTFNKGVRTGSYKKTFNIPCLGIVH
jgi:DNA polymerase-4/DNA polymerase V